MTGRRFITMLVAVGLLPLALSGCLTEDKVLDLVLTGETSTEFQQNETTPEWVKPAIIDVAGELHDILEDNGYSEDDLKQAHVTAASYGVTSFSQAHDWTISGSISVAYNGSPQVLATYGPQSVQEALGRKISVALQQAGVDVINAALEDFLDGQNPVLAFAISNESTAPAPSALDPMVFNWRAWLAIQVIIDQDVEVFDPF